MLRVDVVVPVRVDDTLGVAVLDGVMDPVEDLDWV